jgi:hypothetical protein
MQAPAAELSKCINAAEMGLTQRETSTLLDIPFSQVKELTDRYGIKFTCARTKANQKRSINSPNQRDTSTINNDREGAQPATDTNKTRTRRSKSPDTDRAKRIDEIYNSKLPRAEKYELVYAESLKAFEQKMIDLKLRPPFPEKKRYTPENASTASIRKQREQSINRRQVIMACFKSGQTRVAEDISRNTSLTLRISSQMLDLMYRDGVLTRERVQVGPNKRNSVYHYKRK